MIYIIKPQFEIKTSVSSLSVWWWMLDCLLFQLATMFRQKTMSYQYKLSGNKDIGNKKSS